ncbi:MAG: hypothetical protein ACLPIX_00710 [Rhodomicrobium sp.]
MSEEINRAVSRHAEPHGERPKRAAGLGVPGDKGDRDCSKKQAGKIVELERALTRLVKTFVRAPKKTVHRAFLRGPSDGLHGQKRGEDNRWV